MKGTQLQSIINAAADNTIYGFRMTSGKEIILDNTYRRSDIVAGMCDENKPEDFDIDTAKNAVLLISKIAPPMGPQIPVKRYIDAEKIAEVMFLYDPEIDE